MKQRAALIGLIAFIAGAAPGRAGQPSAFQVGEKLSYQMYWGPFVVGRASLEVAGIEEVDGHDCYHLVASARTSGLANALFPVKSKVESWLDRESLCTRKFRQDRREGKTRRHDETSYDYLQQRAITKSLLTDKVKSVPLDQPVLDVVASIYYLRLQALALANEEKFVVHASSTNYTVRVQPDERRKISVRPTGAVPALRLEPTPTLRIVTANQGRLWFWVSEDPRHLPLMAISPLKIGQAKLVLAEVRAGTDMVAASPSPQLEAPVDVVARARSR